jgi:type IX secretion system PorP/SprF family membrane protein
MKMNISFAGAIFCFLLCQTISAQDIHLSQYHFDRLQINPGLTGIFNGDKQATVIHKQQYFSVPVDYMTFSGTFDMKFLRDVDQKGFFSAGILFNYDQAGYTKLSLMQLGLNGSYTRVLTPSLFATIGASLGGGQRAFDPDGPEVWWGEWWDGDSWTPGPHEAFSRTNFFFLDLGLGANIRLQGKDRTKIDLGIGAFHLNTPNQSFNEGNALDNITLELPVRTAIHALGILKLANRLDLYANGMLQNQGPSEETLYGGGLIVHISNKKAREVELHLGVASRVDDAIIPMIALGYDGWKGGFAYDINTSGFEAATDGKGGPEFFLTYTYKKLRPLQQTKVCSIF